MRAVFLDRDGTITNDIGFTDAPIAIKEGAPQAIKRFNDLGFAVVIATNQPRVARGIETEEEVKKVNEKIVANLAKNGAKIDRVYYCPHHPEQHDDVPEHAKKYRVACECRKPGIGMLEQAASDLDIDLQRSFMVGDSTRDILAGKDAGCTTILLGRGDNKYKAAPDFHADDLLHASEIISNIAKNSNVKAVILAGGRGERLRPITDAIPKPLIEIAGKPVLQHQLEALKKHGICDVVLCGSYLVDRIKGYFGNGSRFGMHIEYPEEPEQLGSGGAVRNAAPLLENAERFIIINGDKMIGPEFDFTQMLAFDREKKGFATVLVRKTDHPLDSDIVKLDGDRVVEFIGRGQDEYITSNSGIIIARPDLLRVIPEGKSNIERDVLFALLGTKEIYGFLMPEQWYVKDMGTPERLASVRKRFETMP